MKLSAAAIRDRLLPITLTQAVGMGCGIIGVKVVSHLVPPATLGIYGVFLTFTTLGMWLIHAGVIRYAGRHWAGAEDRAALLRTLGHGWARKLPWLALAAAGVALAISHFEFGAATNVFFPLFIAASLLSVCALIQTAQQAARAHWQDFFISSIGSVTRSFVPPLLFFFVGSITGLYTGFCLYAACCAAVGLLSMRAYWRPKPDAQSVPVPAVYDGPLFVTIALASWTLAGLNRWLTAWAFGDAEAGLFTLASNIAQIVPAVLGATFLQYTQPGFYALADSGDADLSHRLAKRVDLTAAILCITALAALGALRLVAPWLVGPLIDQRYALALVWILPAGCFALTTMTGYFYHVMLLAGRCEKACGRVDLVTAGILAASATIAASQGQAAFRWTLILSPALIWVLTRPMARAALFAKKAELPAPSPVL
jgi:hypothetical protein